VKDLNSKQAAAHAAFLSSYKKKKPMCMMSVNQLSQQLFHIKKTERFLSCKTLVNIQILLIYVYKDTSQKRSTGNVDILYINEMIAMMTPLL